MARTVGVGEITKEAEHLIRITRESLFAGMNKACVGNRLNDISSSIEQVIRAHRMGVVKELVGHGIGKQMHEPPDIPNFSFRGANPRLREGMVFALSLIHISSNTV